MSFYATVLFHVVTEEAVQNYAIIYLGNPLACRIRSLSKVHIYRYLGYGLNKTRIPLVLDLNGVVGTIYKFAPIPKYVRIYLCTYIGFICVCACVCVLCVWCVLTQRYVRT